MGWVKMLLWVVGMVVMMVATLTGRRSARRRSTSRVVFLKMFGGGFVCDVENVVDRLLVGCFGVVKLKDVFVCCCCCGGGGIDIKSFERGSVKFWMCLGLCVDFWVFEIGNVFVWILLFVECECVVVWIVVWVSRCSSFFFLSRRFRSSFSIFKFWNCCCCVCLWLDFF